MSKKAVIDSIEKKVALLVGENRRLRDERAKISATAERLRGENRRLATKIAEMERRLAVMELREGFSGETADSKGTKAARGRVNRLVREVDRCIALLNKEA
jgi:predicted  nucleic acid-binding Zn-ribbon protein